MKNIQADLDMQKTAVETELAAFEKAREALYARMLSLWALLEEARKQRGAAIAEYHRLQAAASKISKPGVAEIRRMHIYTPFFGDGFGSVCPFLRQRSIDNADLLRLVTAIESHLSIAKEATEKVVRIRQITSAWKNYQEPQAPTSK